MKFFLCVMIPCKAANLLNCNTEKGILYNSNSEVEDGINLDTNDQKNEREIEESEIPSIFLDLFSQ